MIRHAVVTDSKKCPICREVKPLSDFPTRKDHSGFQAYCRVCYNEKYKDYKLKYCYGLSRNAFDAMLAKQSGVCAICHKPETHIDKRVGDVRRMTVDHNHVTGSIRGLLCTKCNIVVGMCGEDIEVLKATIVYLQSFTDTEGD